MLYKTRGIVLNFIKFKETSIISKVYTEAYGIQSYIVNGIRSGQSKGKIALFQPLTLLDLVVYHREKEQINRISEQKCAYPYRSLPFHIKKSSVALFLNEILNKTLKGESEDSVLFGFIFDDLIKLDQMPKGYENFHIRFLLKLSSFLGFAPSQGEELLAQTKHDHLSASDYEELKHLLDVFISSSGDEPALSHQIRNYLLDLILKFYHLHIDNLGEIRSLAVLREVLHN